MVLELIHLEVFLLSDGSEFGKNVLIFGADMSSSMYIENKKKDFLFLRKGLSDVLDVLR